MVSRLRSFEFALLLAVTAAISCASGVGASAATIAVRGDTAVFRAAPGEANDLRIGIWPFDPCSGLVIVVSLCAADAGAPLTAGEGCEQLGANLAACPEDIQDPRRGRPVLVVGGDGDDAVWDESEMREVTLRGGTGDDALRSGSAVGKSPSLFGGQGDDTVHVFNNGSGAPLMRGGLGDDELCSCENGGGLLYGEGGDDRLLTASNATSAAFLSLDGGPGNDVYVARGFSLVGLEGIAPGPGADVLDASGLRLGSSIDLRSCRGCVEWVTGSPGDDEITGYPGRQVLLGGDGLDVIRGRRGPDLLAGQNGDDTIRSRDDSADTVGCGEGVDTAFVDAADLVSRTCENVRRVATGREVTAYGTRTG
jgi:Ca2+-binding RTX toxin-like protein